MLKIITATHRLFFSKESTIFVILNKNRKNIRRGRKTSEHCKTSEGGADLEEPPIFELFHSCNLA